MKDSSGRIKDFQTNNKILTMKKTIKIEIQFDVEGDRISNVKRNYHAGELSLFLTFAMSDNTSDAAHILTSVLSLFEGTQEEDKISSYLSPIIAFADRMSVQNKLQSLEATAEHLMKLAGISNIAPDLNELFNN